jgi:DNA-binding MarR family transcriptional regulator
MAPDPSLLARLKQSRPFPSLGDEAVVAVLVTADHLRRDLSALVEAHDITFQQYNVLRILRGAGAEGIATLEVAARMIEQAPGITRLLDRLEAKGLVRRARCHRDRRQVLCWIEPAGQTLLAHLEQPLLALSDRVGRQLDAGQLQDLISLLARLRQDPPPAPPSEAAPTRAATRTKPSNLSS